MMVRRTGLAVALVCVVLSGLFIRAASAAGAASSPAGKAAAETQFQQVFSQWTEALKQLQAIRVEYQSADEKDRPALQTKFAQLMTQARQLAPKLVAAAEKAYQAAPNKDQKISDLLFRVAFEGLRTDNYEQALRLAKLLIDGKLPDVRATLIGGIAAFNANRYDLAEKYLKAAGQAGLLDPSRAAANRVPPRTIQQATQALADMSEFSRLWAAEQKIRQAEAKADDLPRVKFETTKGPIVLELFENEAPNTVANFVSLVEKGFYNGLSFHRVLPGFMAQGGCPLGNGTGGPGYHIPCECYQKNFRHHFRGSLSMAHAGRDTGGSQFFLTFVRTPHLDGKHTVFGRVIDGMDVLSKLQRIDPSKPGAHPQPDRILKATVVRKRPHPYQPKTVAGTAPRPAAR